MLAANRARFEADRRGGLPRMQLHRIFERPAPRHAPLPRPPLGNTMRAVRRLVLCLPLGLALPVGPADSPARPPQDLEKLEREFRSARDEYLTLLGDRLPAAYREHFASLSDDEMATIARTRRLWQWYIAEGPFTMGDPRKQSTGIFREEFLDPMERVAEILLIRPGELADSDLRKARSKALKLGEKLHRARKAADVELDPTVGKLAPTGIPYPPLDQPHSCVDELLLYERTLVLAKTVAHREAETALMQNAEACAELDLLEADFVMYGNQVRMLSGSIAWVADPLMTACTRDHSNDRKEGTASGHQSTLPGKRFPRDRAQRFGCRVGPEGAGGGATGRQAIRGFAYNGTGHGGPLFAQLRNVVAPGQRAGALTAMYQTDDRLKHACAATEGELVLPPGVTAKDVDSGSLRKAFRALADGEAARAWKALDGKKPDDPFQRAIHRYLQARVEAEVDWTMTGIERIFEAGDVFEAAYRLGRASRAMEGLRDFDRRAKRMEARLTSRAVKAEIEVGRLYQQILSKGREPKRLAWLIEKYPDSVYAQAANHCLEAGADAFWPELFFFVMRDTHLNKWSYLTQERIRRQ